MSLIRQHIFNPKPDGDFTASRSSVDRGAHYKTIHHEQNNIYVFSDNGKFVYYQEPIYVCSLGPKLNRYYTIENKKPREVVTLDTEQHRYQRYLKNHPMHPVADRNKVDLSAKFVEIVHNNAHNANNPYVYLRGQQDERVSDAVEIQKMILGKKYIYYVITKEGHIDSVLSRKGIKKRIDSDVRNQLRRYKKKVEEAKAEDNYREKNKEKNIEKNIEKIKNRKEGEPTPERLILGNLPSINNNKQNIENNAGADTNNQRLKIKFTFSASEEDLRKERESLFFGQGLFSPSKIAELKRKAGQIKKTNQLNNKTIVKTDAEVELKEKFKKLQTQASLKKTICKNKIHHKPNHR